MIRKLESWEEKLYTTMIINCLNADKSNEHIHSCSFDEYIFIEENDNEIFITFDNLTVITLRSLMNNISNPSNIEKITIGNIKLKWPRREEGFAKFVKV
jgi:hypothetical protein